MTRGETTPAFEAALLTLEAGQTCPHPVQTRYGIHVLRLDRKWPGQVLPFAQVRDRIAAWLEERSWRRAVAQYVALLAGGARISGFDMLGEILQGLTDPARAEAVLAAVGSPEVQGAGSHAPPLRAGARSGPSSPRRSATCWITGARRSGWTSSARCRARRFRPRPRWRCC